MRGFRQRTPRIREARALPQATPALEPDPSPLLSAPAGHTVTHLVIRTVPFLLGTPPPQIRSPLNSGRSGAGQRGAGLPVLDPTVAGGGNAVHRKDVIGEALSAHGRPRGL